MFTLDNTKQQPPHALSIQICENVNTEYRVNASRLVSLGMNDSWSPNHDWKVETGLNKFEERLQNIKILYFCRLPNNACQEKS
ncbi:hypothetical protein QQP08_006767 [Theobroma cacao]|nr:hypothetical protein QQP08_006767 [Theobroma cacao]